MNPSLRTDNSHIGIELFCKNPDLQNLETTYLSSAALAGATSLTVQRGTGFAANDYVVINKGSEDAELLQASSAAATSIGIAATAYAHPESTIVQFIPFNQVVIETSADNVSFAVLTTIAIQPDKAETFYLDTTGTDATYYRFRFKNSTTTTYSPYSDAVLGSGYPDNSVHAILTNALSSLGEQEGEVITHKSLLSWLWEGRRIVHSMRKRWQFRMQFDYDLGTISTGMDTIAMPADIEDPNTTQNLMGLRIGAGRNLDQISKREMDVRRMSLVKTTVATEPAIGATSFVLADTDDLPDSGSLMVSKSDGFQTVSWTANNRSTNTLTVPASGDGSIAFAHPVGTIVWYNASPGEPSALTVFEETIQFDRPFSNDYEGRSIIADYYKGLPEYNSDADVLDEPSWDFYSNYLAYRIKKRKANGDLGTDDNDFKQFISGAQLMVDGEVSNQPIRMVPDVAHLDSDIAG